MKRHIFFTNQIVKKAFTRFGSNTFFNLSCILLIFITVATGQSEWQMEWEKRISNENGATEVELFLVEAIDSSAIAAGYISTPDGKRMYVARYDNNGEKEWEQTLNSEIGAQIQDMALSEGHIYIVGNEEFRQTETNPIHYAKIHLEGDVIWHFDLREEVDFYPRGSEIEFVQGDIYIRGSDRSLSSSGSKHWMAKFDDTGEFQWKSTFNPEMDIYFSKMKANKEGQIGISGGLRDEDRSFFLVYDESGDVAWTYPRNITTSDFYFLNSLDSDDQGNWLLTGSRRVNQYDTEAVTIKLDKEGELQWKNNVSLGRRASGEFISSTAEGKIINCLLKRDVHVLDTVLTIALNSDGDTVWTQNISYYQEMGLIGARVSRSGDLFIAVYTADNHVRKAKAVFLHYSSEGVLQNTYEFPADYSIFRNVAIDESFLFACGDGYPTPGQSILLSLSSDSLNEMFIKAPTGLPYSDVQTISVLPRGNHVWTSHTSYRSDSTSVITVSKLDDSGNTMWSIDKLRNGRSSNFEFLELDSEANSLIFYDSLSNNRDKLLCLSKYNTEGGLEFHLIIDSLGQWRRGAITSDKDNNIFLCYYNQHKEALFSKIDPDGNLLWTESYLPQDDFRWFRKMTMQTSAQGKLIAISSRDLYLFGVSRSNIRQYDKEGALEWEQEVVDPSGNFTRSNKLAIDNQDRITVWGLNDSREPLVSKFSSSGELLWTNLGQEEGRQPLVTKDLRGNTYLCRSGLDIQVTKIDPSGASIETVEQKIEGFNDDYYVTSFSYWDGKLIVIGDYSPVNSNGLRYPVTMLFDNELNHIESEIDTLNAGIATATALDENHSVYAAFMQGHPHTFEGGYRRTLLRKYSLNQLTGSNAPYSPHQLTLYPNPVGDELHLIVPKDVKEIESLSLYDMSGKRITDFGQDVPINGNQKLSFRLPSRLLPGQYILSLRSSDDLYTSKVIKSH